MNPTPLPPGLAPDDAFNRELAARTHPPGWVNPAPADRYHLVVIGGGTAGLVTAAGAAGLGARVALVERHLLGGDCLNTGCVPSKALLAAAKAAAHARRAGEFGVRTGPVTVDFPAVMARVRQVRAALSHHDSAARFRDLGVDVFLGAAAFRRAGEIAVGDATLRYRRAVIATGARAALPNVPGLRGAAPLTNETVFNLTELPRRLAVLGGGPIGCELAQAFRRLGAEVTLLTRGERLLPREEPAASAVLAETFAAEGVRLEFAAEATGVHTTAAGHRVHFRRAGVTDSVEADALLVATGRGPNVAGLGLETVGVAHDARRGVRVDDRLRTTNPRIFAAGDVCLAHQFTHAADFSARIVIQNALFPGRKRLSALTIPWCTYTEPEVARVGLSVAEARERGLEVTAFTREFRDVDRARTDGETKGFVQLLVRKGSDELVGATIVGPHAGDLIGEVGVAVAADLGLGALANVIHPYPTLAEALRQCGDAYNRTRLTPRVKRLFAAWLRWTR
jgi:pyruvate/2-oxoglutarate dehydrogenase complex dihydrolipoamide dehydrogenase (E3) component